MTIKKAYILVLINAIAASFRLFSQTGQLEGIVKNSNGQPVPVASISAKDYHLHAVTDTNGIYQLPGLPQGTCDIECRCMGYKIFRKKITIKQGMLSSLNIRLRDSLTELNSVEITVKSRVQEIRESPQTMSVIDMKHLHSQSSGGVDIINKVMGVNVRQAGGLGGDAAVSINGLSGKQLKFFMDGIPLEYYGSELTFNVLPVSLIDRIEICKGVVPIELGADALGGAIHVITRQRKNNYLDISYSFGSFNTHRASVNALITYPGSKFFTAINSFYNYSDNNYYTDVIVPDETGTPVYKKVRRFHDAYANYLIRLENGFSNTRYADVLSLTLGLGGMKDNVQHNPTNSEQPYGKVKEEERSLNAALKFQKKNVMKHLNLNFYGLYNNSTSLAVDTSVHTYTWDGEQYQFMGTPVIHPFVGEKSTNRKLLYFTNDNLVGRVNLSYQFDSVSLISASVTSSYYNRKGKDSIQEKYFGRNYFSCPERMIKNIAGISFEKSFFRKKLTSISSLKYYNYLASGFEINSFKEQVTASSRQTNYGINQALRWRFTKSFLIRTSYEYATRLPDATEAFGDFLDTNPNPSIKPERSNNLNFGIQNNHEKYGFEINAFYRYTDQIIYLKSSRFFSQYQNLLKAETRGVEAEFYYKPVNVICATVNATYQDIRNKSTIDNSAVTDDRYLNARLPNIPYFFANGSLLFQKEKILKDLQNIQVWWNCNYAHSFYLYWATDGDKNTKAIIPSQFLQNAGISVMLIRNSLTCTMEVLNITNRKAYDNFSIQKPGRSFSLKLRYFISKI